MRIDVLSVLPRMVEEAFREGVVGRAIEAGVLEFKVWNLRDFAEGKYQQTDDAPFGGGAGMVMKPEPILKGVRAIREDADVEPLKVLLTPQGRLFDQATARRFSRAPRMLLICGRYEGVDERVRDHLVDREVSVADVVVSGGEIPALLVIDAVARRVPGVLGAEDSLAEESFDDGLLEYPQYTRPRDFRGWGVPPVLLSGDHGAVARWRRGERVRRTRQRRPDLLAGADLSEHERAALAEPGAGPGDAGTGPAGGLDPSAPDP